ncbi:MAG TPA: c-type cytochrome [Gemmataceae bacterium]|nr:c-type cytochrome [Gemmataceae bacterium]
MSVTLGHPSAGDPAAPEIVVSAPPVVAVVGVVPERPRWHAWRTAFLISLPALLVVYVWLAATGIHGAVEYRQPAAAPAVDTPEPNGAALYMQNCARCHGERGAGNGFASLFLDPPARRFGEERFQLGTTTPNAVPTDDDLIYVVRHGIPGTAMPAFDQLSDAERRAIVSHVRLLAHCGLFAKLFKRAEQDGDADVAEVAATVVKQLTPGPPLEIPKGLPPPTPESIARGQQIFAKNCATCHGPKGAGDGPQVKDMKNDNGRPTRPRDLARGVFKGGDEPDRVYARIALGMPGTPMPASLSALKPNEIGDLVNFVLSLCQRADSVARQGTAPRAVE